MSAAAEVLRAHLARSERADALRVAERVASLRAKLPRLAATLVELGAGRAWLFGSLVWGGAHIRSDLDIAVEGLPRGHFFDAYERLWQLHGEPVDLVSLEHAPETLRARVLAGGEQIL